MSVPFVSVPTNRSYTAAAWFQWNDGGVHKPRFDLDGKTAPAELLGGNDL